MGIVIEPLASVDEVEAMREVERASFTNPWTLEMYLAELKNPEVSFFFLARADGDVVGFCSFWRVLDEQHINNLAVVPNRRREGIGSALLAHVLREGAGLGAVRATLEVRRSNDAARRLYERFGFTVAGIRRAYYTSPSEDALVLWREELPTAGEPHG